MIPVEWVNFEWSARTCPWVGYTCRQPGLVKDDLSVLNVVKHRPNQTTHGWLTLYVPSTEWKTFYCSPTAFSRLSATPRRIVTTIQVVLASTWTLTLTSRATQLADTSTTTCLKRWERLTAGLDLMWSSVFLQWCALKLSDVLLFCSVVLLLSLLLRTIICLCLQYILYSLTSSAYSLHTHTQMLSSNKVINLQIHIYIICIRGSYKPV